MLLELLVIVAVIWVVRRWLMREQIALAKQLKTNIKMYPILGHTYKLFGTSEDQMKSVEGFGRDSLKAGGVSKFLHFDHLMICVSDPITANVLLQMCLEKHYLMKLLRIVIGDSSIIAEETTMGVKTKFEGSEFLNSLEELWRIGTTCLLTQPWILNKYVSPCMPCYNTILKHKLILFNHVKKIIQEKQRLLNDKSIHEASNCGRKKGSSFLDIQLQPSDCSQKFSEQELIEDTLMLIEAGHDTTAINILLKVFGDSDRAVTYEDLPQLKYLEAVIKETLRLYPVVPLIIRQVDNDVKLPSGITIVKGCGVAVNIWGMHRHPAYWGADADQFRPERFLDRCPTHPAAAAFMPFSYGLRGCPGYRYAMLSMKTTLSTLLRRYRVLAPPGVPQGEPLRTKYEILMRYADNYEIQLERRK